MLIESKDGKKYVDIGTADIWFSVYSTVIVRLKGFVRTVPLAVRFLESAECGSDDALETARQLNLIRDELSQIPPSQAVYDLNDRTREPFWKDNLSPIVTSCANLYITADGKDLLFELVSILTYSAIAEVPILTTER